MADNANLPVDESPLFDSGVGAVIDGAGSAIGKAIEKGVNEIITKTSEALLQAEGAIARAAVLENMATLARYRVTEQIAKEYAERASAAVTPRAQEILTRIGSEFGKAAQSAEASLVAAAQSAVGSSSANAAAAAVALLGPTAITVLGQVPSVAIAVAKIDAALTKAEQSGASSDAALLAVTKEVVSAGVSTAAGFTSPVVSALAGGLSLRSLLVRASGMGIALSLSFEAGWWLGTKLNDVINGAIGNSATPTRRDPLILDLDSNGIATTNATTNAIHFDHDANGFAEATGWLNPDDAFLAVDRNGNGTIDSGLELFGDQTLLRSGAKATSGLQALGEWDSNRDGQISATDTRYTDLRVWTDTNQDGISQADELHTLTDAGIASISLTGTATHTAADANGNTVTRTGTFTRTDGISGLAGEVTFKRDTALSIPVATYTVTDAIAAQPDLSGYGNLLDLHQALAKEVGAGGTALASALGAYLTASTVGAGDTAIRDTALDQFLYTWANAASVLPASRGAALDARQIAFLEAAFGQSLGNPDSNAAVQW
ncbi:MAG: hypothetical protein HZB40_20120, partial [Rhodocyclales bacterium]|nr:hypothetical protein [Rhodocyclales bacterium]